MGDWAEGDLSEVATRCLEQCIEAHDKKIDEYGKKLDEADDENSEAFKLLLAADRLRESPEGIAMASKIDAWFRDQFPNEDAPEPTAS